MLTFNSNVKLPKLSQQKLLVCRCVSFFKIDHMFRYELCRFLVVGHRAGGLKSMLDDWRRITMLSIICDLRCVPFNILLMEEIRLTSGYMVYHPNIYKVYISRVVSRISSTVAPETWRLGDDPFLLGRNFLGANC